MSRKPAAAARIFLSYAHEDEDLRRDLVTHLSPLQRQGLIADWHDRKIVPGQEWADEIDRHLEEADAGRRCGRGGGWRYPAELLRAANRLPCCHDFR